MDAIQKPDWISRQSAAGSWLGAGSKAGGRTPLRTSPSQSKRKAPRPSAPRPMDRCTVMRPSPLKPRPCPSRRPARPVSVTRGSALDGLLVKAAVEEAFERIFLVERAELDLVGLHL